MFRNYEYIISLFFTICYFIIIPTIEAQTDTTRLAELETIILGQLPSNSMVNYVYNIKTLKNNFKEPSQFFVSLTTCKIPLIKNLNKPPASQLEIYISTKSKNPGPSNGGVKYITNEGFLNVDIKNTNNELYLGVYAPKLSGDYNNNDYYFQVGASTKGFLHQAPTETGLMLDDTDGNNALLRTYTNTKQPLYNTYFVESSYVKGISKSLCAYIKNKNVTYAGRERSGKFQSSIFINNLNIKTTYSALVTETSDGGLKKLFLPIDFQTRPNNNCAIVNNLEFCNKVSYSAPKPNDMDYVKLDNLAKSYFDNFTIAIDQYPCDDPDSKYSLVRNCNDCKEAYKDWICAITIPRCASEDLNENVVKRAQLRIGIPSLPYTELVPCIDLCHNVTRSCPAILGFNCPNSKIISHYGANNGSKCNSLDNDFPKSNVAIRIWSSSQWTLAFVLGFIILVVGI